MNAFHAHSLNILLELVRGKLQHNNESREQEDEGSELEKLAWIECNQVSFHWLQHWKKLDVLGSQRVMADLSNLALTCKEMSQQISVHALPVLAEKVHRTAWERSGVETGSNDKPPAIWDKILCAPKACTLPELKVQSDLP